MPCFLCTVLCTC